MGAVSYPDKKVVAFVSERLIPIQVLSDAKPISDDFQVKWTPTLIVLDQEGREHHRSVGFLPPEELIPFLMLGMAKARFDHDEFKEALELLAKVLSEYPGSAAAPEAFYLRGITLYKTTEDGGKLKETYEGLRERYPESAWTKKASPYRLL